MACGSCYLLNLPEINLLGVCLDSEMEGSYRWPYCYTFVDTATACIDLYIGWFDIYGVYAFKITSIQPTGGKSGAADSVACAGVIYLSTWMTKTTWERISYLNSISESQIVRVEFCTSALTD